MTQFVNIFQGNFAFFPALFRGSVRCLWHWTFYFCDIFKKSCCVKVQARVQTPKWYCCVNFKLRFWIKDDQSHGTSSKLCTPLPGLPINRPCNWRTRFLHKMCKSNFTCNNGSPTPVVKITKGQVPIHHVPEENNCYDMHAWSNKTGQLSRPI